ncbi:MAG TPA: GNAT family N-acetyltransferase [Gemmataceae bacterium]|nr:GNAT family N-acetyltransferase [Gemmataceae bacterium]
MAAGLEIRPADPFGPEATLLIARLSAELAATYPEYSDSGAGAFEPADAAGPRSAFLIAWLDGKPVGCAAIRPMEPGVAEFKRLYVEPDVRRRGIAGQLLAALEEKAREFGYTAVRLETGVRQPGSIRASESAGYLRIANYGIHAGNPFSVCFEKCLK